MLIERVWAANRGRNFHYLVACPETREALAVDPLNAEACLARARELGWRITQIFNTHEHQDHTGGNAAMVAATGAPVLAHKAAAERIGGVTQALSDGDLVLVDRAYNDRQAIAQVLEAGGQVILRYNSGAFPLLDLRGQPFTCAPRSLIRNGTPLNGPSASGPLAVERASS